jgi:hypothetical protein
MHLDKGQKEEDEKDLQNPGKTKMIQKTGA